MLWSAVLLWGHSGTIWQLECPQPFQCLSCSTSAIGAVCPGPPAALIAEAMVRTAQLHKWWCAGIWAPQASMEIPSSTQTWIPSHNKMSKKIRLEVLLDFGLKWDWVHSWRIWVDWGSATSSTAQIWKDTADFSWVVTSSLSNIRRGKNDHHKRHTDINSGWMWHFTLLWLVCSGLIALK